MQNPAQPDRIVLDVDHLVVRIGATTILRDLSFKISRGASVAVIGPNGAGKTVLFRALIGALPIQGTIRWATGIRFGYVPQKLDLTRDVPITGDDFLRARAAIGGFDRSTMFEALAAVGLTAAACQQSIGSLSGGQFQRLLVAFALMGRPDVLLLDEPTAGVDEPGQERLNELIQRLQEDRGLTVFLISHDIAAVSRHATDALFLSGGRGHFGPPRTILTPDFLQSVYGANAFHVHEH